MKGVSHVFNFDTPWHPDDYVHRIGRTGRGGATGRAFTLVADEDAEAIANVEKLTGSEIPLYEIGGAGEGEGVAAEDRPAERTRRPRRDESRKPARREREERPARATTERAEPTRSERPERTRPEPAERSTPRRARPERGADRPAPAAAAQEAPTAPGDWNGPVPGFLHVSALPA